MSDLPGSTPPPPSSGPTSGTPAGWYPDPLDRHDHRWFDGSAWSANVADDGRPGVDPFGTDPTPAGQPLAPRFDGGSSANGGRNGLATAAMVCGILAVLTAWVPFVVVAGIVLAVLGLVFGIVGLRRSSDGAPGRGRAIAGIVTGGVGLALAVVGIVLTTIVWREVVDFVDPAPHDLSVTSCEVVDGLATVRGTLTNEDRRTASFTVFADVDGTTRAVSLDDVPPGETVEWRQRLDVPLDDGDCEPDVTVNGPFPFGLELDPVE